MITQNILSGQRLLISNPIQPVLTGNNTVADPSFENNGTTGWTTSNSTVAIDSGVARIGSKSLKMTVTSSGAQTYRTETSITSGTRKIFKLWVKGDGTSAGKFVQLRVEAAADGTHNTYQDSVPVMLDANIWKEIWVTWNIPLTGSVTYALQSFDMSNGMFVWADDMVIDTYTMPQVTAGGRGIQCNGAPIFLRGSNYNNTATGEPGGQSFAYEKKQLRYDFEDLKAQGVNMIRIYSDNFTNNAREYWRGLDEAYRNGIGVMVLYFIWLTGTDYTQATGATNRTSVVNSFKAMITTLKNHPAIIAWGIGSETNFNLGTNTLTDWFTLLDACCVGGKTIDNSRVYYTSNGDLWNAQQDSLVPNLDVWGVTLYRGTSIAGVDTNVRNLTQKPFIITEIGATTYQTGFPDGNQLLKGTTDVGLLKQSESFYPVCVGHTQFQWMDDRGDTSMYGQSEVLATGSAQIRPKRLAYSMIQSYYQSNALTAITTNKNKYGAF